MRIHPRYPKKILQSIAPPGTRGSMEIIPVFLRDAFFYVQAQPRRQRISYGKLRPYTGGIRWPLFTISKVISAFVLWIDILPRLLVVSPEPVFLYVNNYREFQRLFRFGSSAWFFKNYNFIRNIYIMRYNKVIIIKWEALSESSNVKESYEEWFSFSRASFFIVKSKFRTILRQNIEWFVSMYAYLLIAVNSGVSLLHSCCIKFILLMDNIYIVLSNFPFISNL